MARWRARLPALVLVCAAVAAVSNLALWLAGSAPAHVWHLVLAGTFGNPYGFAQTLAKATPLALTGAAVAVGLRAGLFNIGAEGQVTAAIVATAVVAARLPAQTPWWLAIPVASVAAASAGAVLGAIPGYLRGRTGAHEVITTLMLNGLVAVLATWLYGGPLRVGDQVHTQTVVAGARLAGFDRWIPALHGTALSVAVVLAVLVPFGAHALLHRTSLGLRIRAVGGNAEAARAVGVGVTRTYTQAMALSGAIAGLAAVHYVLGAKGYAEQGMGAGVGFAGLAVAMLGGGRPMGIVLASVALAALAQGGLVVNAIVPADVLAVVQVAAMVGVSALWVRWRGRGA